MEKMKTISSIDRQPVILVACGSFNPITIMHLRLMEMTRDYFNDCGYEVIAGYFSPVGDGYSKQGLRKGLHRNKMVELATKGSDWVMMDTWEADHTEWTRTITVLDHFNEEVNRNRQGKKVKVVLVCGSDLLESFSTPGVWTDQDIIDICTNHGVGVVAREGSDPVVTIWSNDLLYSLRKQIHIVHQWIPNDISSTKVRLALARGLSVKYLIPDTVLEYINETGLYGNEKTNPTI